MPRDPRDYQLDLSTADQTAGEAPNAAAATPSSPATSPPPAPTSRSAPALAASTYSAHPARPFLSVNFACCGVYQRIYRAADGTHYAGRCPRCGKPVRFVVGPGGTPSRSFTVS